MKRVGLLILVASLCVLAAARSSDSPAKKSTLVLIDNAAFYTTHSQFFKQLSELGHSVTIEQVTVRSITDGQIKLEVDKEMLYDNIIFMASSLAELPETTNFNLARFFEKGGNIFFIIDNDVSPFFREYFKKFGFGLDKSGSYLVDYEKALDATKPQIFNVHNFRDISMLVEDVDGPLVYSGLGLETTIFENTQISTFARGSLNTASVVYTTNGKRFASHMSRNNLLILGIQGLEEGRIVVSGSLEMFSNKFFTLSKGSNRVYSKNLVEWLSYERGSVRKVGYSYSCIDKDGKDSECPKKSRFRFSIDLEYWNWKTKTWVPYSDDNVSLELTMMTPKYRQVLPESQTKKGHYAIFAHIPNRMGTYRFKISHSRPGWKRVSLYKKIMVRNKTNVEFVRKWNRDLVAAVGVLCIMLSFAVVSYIFLYYDDRASFIN